MVHSVEKNEVPAHSAHKTVKPTPHPASTSIQERLPLPSLEELTSCQAFDEIEVIPKVELFLKSQKLGLFIQRWS